MEVTLTNKNYKEINACLTETTSLISCVGWTCCLSLMESSHKPTKCPKQDNYHL